MTAADNSRQRLASESGQLVADALASALFDLAEALHSDAVAAEAPPPRGGALSADEARAELMRSRETQFDPDLVDLFLAQLDGGDRRGADRPFTVDLHLMAEEKIPGMRQV